MKGLAGGLAALVLACAAAPAHALTQTTVASGVSRATISADGSQILLDSSEDLVPADEDGHPELPDQGGWYRLSVGAGTFSRIARPFYNDKGEFTGFVGPASAILSPDGSTVAGDGASAWASGSQSDSGWVVMTGAGPYGDRIIGPTPFTSPPRLATSRDGAHVAWDSYNAGGLYSLYYDGRELLRGGMEPSLSYDGRLMAYTRQIAADRFVVRVRNMRTGTERVASSDAKNRARRGYGATISGDGRYVAFRSPDALVPNARNWMHVYVKDLKTDRVRVASLTAKGHLAKGLEAKFVDPYSGEDIARISGDGRYVAFQSRAPLAKGDSGNDVDLYVKDMFEGGVVRVPTSYDNREVPGGRFALSGNGRWLTVVEDDRTVRLTSLTDDSPFCTLPAQYPDEGLDGVDLEIVKQHLAPTTREVSAAEKALAADTRRNPGSRAANAKLLASLHAMEKRYRVRASAARSDDEVSKLVDDAKCTLLADGHKFLSAYLKDKGHDDRQELAERLLKLKDVLNGDADIKERKEILKDSIQDLIEKLAGKDRAKKYTSSVTKSYDILEAWTAGTLSKELKESFRKQLIAQFKKASQKFLGDDAPELVDRLLDLRDVLAGSVDDKKRAKMLEDSLAALAKKLFGKGLLNSPQVRAAMFGFQLGRAFGDRLAADLEFIANKELAGDCAVALAPSQDAPGAIDYSKPARGIVPKPLWHEGWECVVLPEAFVPENSGGLVQATRPADASVKNKLLWRITTTGTVVTYDPSYSR